MRVVVLSGGRSSEHDVSLASGALGARPAWSARGPRGARRADRARRALAPRTSEERSRVVPGAGLLDADVVFPVLHGPFGEDGTVQGLLEALDVPYVGAGVLASAVCMDKLVFKELMAAAGPAAGPLRGGRRRALERATRARCETAVGRAGACPCSSSRRSLGSSVGHRPAWPRRPSWPRRSTAPSTHEARVIVEAAAPGIEVECSVIGHTTAPEASEPGEIVLRRGAGWYDFEAKYEAGGMELVVPARHLRRRRASRPRACPRGLHARRGLRPGARRLLRRRRRRARQRAQHDPRLHRDERLRQAVGGDRPRLRRAARAPGDDRARAPRAQSAYRH